ncbi:unnamed protein product [Adineta steineri]|uniref:[histone H3]-lysine(27) N-trimethyltransferase n=1 Tax=Adineta steineri TaxID=433720 RepID=A0A815GVE7_9BILA|nr:unnamed protein product [Adineta steineri]CAF3819373.1 unnamed protein product [Adineta steineri]
MTDVGNEKSIVEPIWKERIDRAFKHISRTIDLRQRRDVVSFFATIAEHYKDLRHPTITSEPIHNEQISKLYTTCSYDELTGEKLICSLSILPQIDPIPHMFTYVPLQRNYLCDTVTNLSDLVLEEEDEDIKNLLNSVQSDSSNQEQPIRLSSTSKRTRRLSKTSPMNDKKNEIILDEDHLMELLKRLKQQPGHTSIPMTVDDESNLFETLIKTYSSSADLIRDRFGTIFESKHLQPKEFTPNIDNSSLAVDTTVENILHSYFMLFCRRCHRYDCFLHRDKQAVPDLNIEPKNSNPMCRPCSRHCYRTNPIPQRRTKIELKRSYSDLPDNKTFKLPLNGFHSKRTKLNMIKTEPISPNYNFLSNGFLLKPSLKRKLTDELSEWSASDKSLFRVFYLIYGDNICMIADLLDKSCSQVYVFYTNEIQINEKNHILQRQSSTMSTSSTVGSFSGVSSASSDSNDIKTNGEHHKKKKVHGLSKANNDDKSTEDTTKICNGKDEQHLTPNNRSSSSRRSHSSSFRRQRSHQQILLNHHNNLSSEKKRHTYYPCDHDSSMPCNEDCYCVRSGNFCEKYCCCSPTKCDNRFPGCRCRSSCTTKQCPCYAAARECDPDLCTQCGADDFRSVNNELKTSTSCSCHNVAIQRSLHKPLLLAESDVAGWGMFTTINIQRNEFIAEYCGEILTQDEGELRGRMYDTIGTSFLFDLNEEYMVDATRRGNKIRFANHSINPNCYAKVIMVNGDHRIGIYSKRFITAGEELFFDYRYGANHHLRFVGVEKNTCGDQIDT